MPRLGLGSIDLSATTGGGNSVTGIDDFFFESFTAGQMHPIRTASRTNLVLQSQTIRTSPWTLENFGTDTDLYSAPNSTTTAQSISLETANDQVYAQQVISIVAGKTYTFSAHLKKGALDFGALLVFDGTTSVSHVSYFNIATGTAQGSGSNIIRSAVDAMGDGWYRCSITFQALSSVSGIFRVYASAASNSPATGSGTQVNIPLAYVWGTQVEENGFPSAYIPTVGSTVTVATILNDTSEVWDFDGTDIMIAEDPEDEGFWEESYPDGATLPELVLNGDYADISSELFADGTFSAGGAGEFVADDGNLDVSQNTGKVTVTSNTEAGIKTSGVGFLTQNKCYILTFDVISATGGLVSGNIKEYSSNIIGTWNGVGSYTIKFKYSNSSSQLRWLSTANIGDTIEIDNVSLKEFDPNDRWSLGTSWSIEDGKLKNDGTNTGFQSAQQNNVTVVGDTYEVTVTVEATSGAVELKGSSMYTRIDTLGVGTHTFNIVADATYIRFLAHASATITLDNFTVREYAIQPLDI